MRQKKIVSGAVVMALGLMLAGCSGGKASFSEAPQTEFKELRDESFAADMTGAEIPVLALEKPIDFCYSSPEAEMLFKMEGGVWQDATDKEIPIDQERFQAMADVFLNLCAVSEVENPGDLDQYGLDDADHSVYITDGEKGEKYLFIGDADPDGNYYMTIEESENIYTIKPEALDALVFDYDSLVVRDSLDLTASAGDLIKAVTVVDGKTVSYKTADTEAMTRIAAGMTALKPQEFASFHATGPELTSAGLTEDQRMTLDVEFSNGGNTESLTVYVGNFVDVMGEKRYLQMEGSNMIAIVDAAVIGDLLNLTEEQNSIQNTK